MTRIQRLRWRIATLLNLLPGQCWSSLVDWVFGFKTWPWVWSPMTSECRADVVRCGACYCGKLRRPDREVSR